MPEQKVATAADFRKRIKEEDCFEEPEYVILPKCGLGVMLRRPKPLAYTLLGAPLPGLPVGSNGDGAENAEAEAAESADTLKPEETVQVATWMTRLWLKVFVSPGLSLMPGPEEIHPDWIPEEDQKFVWRWIRGEVTSSGENLSESFRGERG